MIKRYEYTIIISILLLSGCAPKVKLPQPVNSEENQTKPTSVFSDRPSFNPNIDEKYHLKPEPYSLSSDQKDPELLGPQSTIKNNPLKSSNSDIEETNIDDSSSNSNGSSEIVSEVYDNDNKQSVATTNSSSMSRSQCINMVGESTFNSYVKKYGSESAAIRRCALLSRLHR